MKPVDIFHLGPQKSATTWLYRCLQEHPQVACAPKDSIHYYDMFYERGEQWYASHFEAAEDGQVTFDTTPSYIRSTLAPARMHRDNPAAKLAITLRHPIDRAFSHYWHVRKNPRTRFEFEDVLRDYDLFASWIEPGFYAGHIERYLAYFPREQLLCQSFDTLKQQPQVFLREILEFLDVDSDFTPSFINTRINEAKCVRTRFGIFRVRSQRALGRWLGSGFLETSFAQWMTSSREYSRGIDDGLYNRLLEICVPEIEQTEKLLNMDLSHWKVFRQ